MKRDDYLTSTVFRNFVLSAYSAGDYELLRSFIENNSSKLKPSDYNDMLNFGYAYYYLGLKKYRKVFKGINNIMINNFIYKFDIRNIELRIYYETNKIELLSGIIHNYHKAVINDKMLTKTDKDRLFKLLKYFNKLITLKNNLNINKRMKEADYYVNLLEKEPSWGMKKWLIEKFNELKKPDRVEVKRTKAANK